MSVVQGDGQDGQPGEDVSSIDDLADSLMPEGLDEDASDDPDSDESEESEESEDEEEGEGEEDEEEARLKFTIKHDGKDVDLDLSPAEHAEMLQKSFDYTNKTMAVAKEREAVQAEKSKVTAYREEVEQARTEQLTRLQALEQFYNSQIGTPPPVEWASQDAGYYIAQKEQYEARKGQLDNARQSIHHLQSEQARERQAWIVQQADATEAALKDTLPGWNEQTLPELASYAEKFGLTPKTTGDAFVQKGLWETLHKAKAYDALLAKKAEMKPVTKLAKVTKPQASNPIGKAAARAKRDAEFDKNPSVDALANIFMPTRK